MMRGVIVTLALAASALALPPVQEALLQRFLGKLHVIYGESTAAVQPSIWARC